jgi:membrane-associated protein
VVGPKVFHRENVRFLNRKHLERTHEFYERYGGKTIVIARFVPIVRTFAPFVAGIGKMTYGHFLSFNVIGGAAWVLGFVMAGFWFGNIPVVKRNFTFVIFAIIIVSVLPAVIEFFRQRARARATD